ncbi:hypothetical protein TNCV_4002381 [Trichonephila clavipes]|uniref:Uncharacterized protein n=1 Tax=Trichonephila clavipes TaxID=2585209 RepID=A0A8X6RTA5_TRICX|nr:hypothetical protein TNCV_4002381 [Trichonephila clavipes]
MALKASHPNQKAASCCKNPCMPLDNGEEIDLKSRKSCFSKFLLEFKISNDEKRCDDDESLRIRSGRGCNPVSEEMIRIVAILIVNGSQGIIVGTLSQTMRNTPSDVLRIGVGNIAQRMYDVLSKNGGLIATGRIS